MNLPIQPPFAPMEAALVDEIPSGENWQYEPKWDGFRCLAFREGDEVRLQSKSGQDLTRYFPEVARHLRELRAAQFALDGELAVPAEGLFSFDALLQRIHPATSRVQKLAGENPALYIVFDLLVDEVGRCLVEKPLRKRRRLLEKFAGRFLKNRREIRLSPSTTALTQARKWLNATGADLDGVVAKRADLPYCSGERAGMQKIKKQRTADCVVGGFRYASHSPVIGSLLLGLYNEQNLLDHVGFCSGLERRERRALKKRLEPLVGPPGFSGHAPGGPSRWSTKRSMEWVPLKPRLVVEVSYDHFTGGRFRHGTRLIRWRPDKGPEQCRVDQVESKAGPTLALFSS
jgi:ATP-dependent DNA ligase